MSTMQVFYTTAPESGMITLPEELRGKPLKIVVENEKSSVQDLLNSCGDDFWRKKPLDEIVAEQGGPRVCMKIDDYFGWMSDFWESDEEMEEFLRKRKEEI